MCHVNFLKDCRSELTQHIYYHNHQDVNALPWCSYDLHVKVKWGNGVRSYDGLPCCDIDFLKWRLLIFALINADEKWCVAHRLNVGYSVIDLFRLLSARCVLNQEQLLSDTVVWCGVVRQETAMIGKMMGQIVPGRDWMMNRESDQNWLYISWKPND